MYYSEVNNQQRAEVGVGIVIAIDNNNKAIGIQLEGATNIIQIYGPVAKKWKNEFKIYVFLQKLLEEVRKD